jgi:O-antigen/teichoic acid export membrane protein
MGIIKQQTIKGTIYSYLGVLIGFISLNIIQPHALTTEAVGLVGILISYANLFSQFATLGFSGTARYFPYFRNEEKKHHGYLFLFCLVSLVGIAIFIAVIYIFKHDFISDKSQTSTLFNQYYWYLVPLIVFTVYFNVLDLYARLLYNAISGKILREFTKRLFIFFSILLIYWKVVSFGTFMIIWLIANLAPTLILMGRLIYNNELFLQPNFKFLDRSMIKKLTDISLLGILTGSSPLIIENVDKYIINQKYGLSDTGVYTIAFYFATVITLPARSLYSITTTVVSEAWKANDLSNIKSIYEKSCINQLIAALFLLIIIWANIDNIFHYLPAKYEAGKYVVLFIGIGNLIDSATGINGVILTTSKYFKWDGFFYLFLVFVTVSCNYLLIPIYGITGAALSALITFLSFNLFRYIFIYRVLDMQPFNMKNLYALVLGVGVYFISLYLIPQQHSYVLDGIIRTAFITVIYWLCTYFFKLSDDINYLFTGYMIKLKIKR